MNSEELRTLQAPIKAHYREEPGAGLFTLRAEGKLGDEGLTCKVETGRGLIEAGLHQAAGGDGSAACSGDMLLGARRLRRGSRSRRSRPRSGSTSGAARSRPRGTWISGGRWA